MTLDSIVQAIIGHVDAARARLKTAIIGPRTPEEVHRVLAELAAQNPEKLAWETSATDLFKLLDFDSSLEDRKDMAAELGYRGKFDGSAKMNEWLHEQVMKMVADRKVG